MKIVRYPHTIHNPRVVDGDTIEAWLDLESIVRVKVRIRLKGIECAELDEPDGPKAAASLMAVLQSPAAHTMRIASGLHLRDCHGRIVSDILLGDGSSVVDRLLGTPYFWRRSAYADPKKEIYG